MPSVQQVLNRLPSRVAIFCNAPIAGYAQVGHAKQALDFFEEMQLKGIQPDEVTYVCNLKACAFIGAIAKGKQIHDKIVRQGLLQKNIVLSSALVDMRIARDGECR